MKLGLWGTTGTKDSSQSPSAGHWERDKFESRKYGWTHALSVLSENLV